MQRIFEIEKFKEFLLGIDGGNKTVEIAQAIENDIIYFFSIIPFISQAKQHVAKHKYPEKRQKI